MNDLNASLLTVFGVLAGLALLLVLMTALEPAKVRRGVPSQGSTRNHVEP